jgi:hypothetical protein
MSLAEFRTPGFTRNEVLETLLADLGDNLHPAEDRLVSAYMNHSLPYPVILVMGPLRSGTTLFMQWLANLGFISYPSNLLSRFYRTPIIGAKIQLLLTDPRYSFRNELGEFEQSVGYASENGKTAGVLAPNEFWYFWRRFLAEPARDVWADEELGQSMDTRTMRAELAGMMDVFKRPFAAKGMLFNYNIPFLDSVFDKALFIQIRRDPVSNVASVLEARKRQLGSEAEWYSFRIPEYEELKDLDPVRQAAGQVYYINKAVSAGMSRVSEERKLVIDYEKFCANPGECYSDLVAKLGMGESAYAGLHSFPISSLADMKKYGAIESALAEYAGR